MEGYDLLLIVLFVCFVSSSGFPATNLRAVYVADGSINVTWDHPATTFERVFNLSVYESDQRLKVVELSANEHVYRYIHSHTRPNTAYRFKLDTVISYYVEETTITTPSATYGQRGTRLTLFLPRPSGSISFIVKNKGTILAFKGDAIISSYLSAESGETVNVTPRDTELTITHLEPRHAGYYYIKQLTENKIIGGKMLVVTDTPTRPTITRSNCFSLPTTSLILTCSSQSRSKPDSHGLVLTTSWKLNGSDVNNARVSIQGDELTISPVLPTNIYDVFTCGTQEMGPGVGPLNSQESKKIKLTPCSTNLTAVYVADGTIKVTWDPPITTERNTVFRLVVGVYDSDVRLERGFLSVNERVYRYINTRPNTTYTLRVHKIISNFTDIDETIITTPPAIYQQRGTRVTLSLPRPSNGSSLIVFNGKTRFSYFDDENVGGNTTVENDLTVNLTSTYTQLTINSLEPRHAGFYYTMKQNGIIIPGGQMLVVTDTPTRPTITRSNCVSPPTTSLTLKCSSRSRSKPDNHGLDFMTSWKVNGSDVNLTRVSIDGAHLTVDPVLPTDIYDVFTCETHEKGSLGLAPIDSQESEYLKMTPGCVPERPVDFRASKVSFSYISVMWTSGYNGGFSQAFHIESMGDGSSWLPVRWNISDAGQGTLMEYTLSDLTAATDFVIRLKVSNKHGSVMSSEITARTLKFQQSPDTQLNMTIGFVTAGVILLICVIVLVVFVIKLKRRHQEQTDDKRSQNIQSNTTSLELQNRAVIRGRPDSRIREPEGAYATVDENILTDHVLPAQSGVAQNDDNFRHSYLTVIGDDAYMDMKPPVGGASRNEESDQYIDLKHTGGGASKNGDKPQYKNMEQTGSRTPQNDRRDHYVGLKQTRGHGHVYDTTNPEPRAVAIDELKGRASDDNKKEDVLLKMTRSKTL